MHTEIEKKPRAKRTVKERGVGQLLEATKANLELVQRTVERAIQAQRQERFRQQKAAESIQAILQQNLDIRGQVRRMWAAIPEDDRAKLEAAGYFGPRKDRT